MMRLRIFGHPAHTPLTHFPLALLTVATLWDLAGLFLHEDFLPLLAYWTMAAGLVFSLPAALTGFLDLVSIPAQDPAMRTGLRHMTLVLIAAGLYTASIFMRDAAHPAGSTALACSIAGMLAITAGGWFGGELVYGGKQEKQG